MDLRPDPPRILLVSRCGDAAEDVREALRSCGLDTSDACCGEGALEEIAKGLHDLVVLYTCDEGEDGFRTLIQARAMQCATEFIVVDHASCREVEVRVQGFRSARYLTGRLPCSDLCQAVEEALKRAGDRREAVHRRWRHLHLDGGSLVGESPAMQRVYELVERVAEACVPVLLTGETGTGKDLVARAIHSLSRRAAKPFVPISCVAVPENLIESTLFGHLRGSFTGAVSNQKGLLERAAGGTVLLDEVESISPALQGKLLRAVQERTIQRVGDRHDIPLDFRLVSATNVDLAQRVRDGRFREDLYYRLNVFPIHLPPLRERPEDVPRLARYFRDSFAAEDGLEPLLFPECCMEWLVSYAWPGNVRELKHTVERALLLSQGEDEITCESVAHVWRQEPVMSWTRPLVEEWSLERLERAYMAKVLEKTRGHKSEAARILGIDRRTLYRKLRRASRKLVHTDGRQSGSAMDLLPPGVQED